MEIWRPSEHFAAASAVTDASGEYLVEGLETDTYVAVTDSADFVDEVYDDIPCGGRPGSFECPLEAATLLHVIKGTTVENVDFTLDSLGAIAGTVRDGAVDAPLPGLRIEIRTRGGSRVATGSTDAGGEYLVDGLEPGSYVVLATSSAYVDELFDDVPCVGLGGVRVDAWNAGGAPAGSTTTLRSGEYFLQLDPGTYFVSTRNQLGHTDQVFGGALCGAVCNPLSGTPIAVEASGPQEIVDGIDFTLSGGTSLIFLDGFESGDVAAWSP